MIHSIKSIVFNLRGNKQIMFVATFFLSYGFFYGLNYILTGLLQPGGYYSPILDEYFDYIEAFKDLLLRSTSTVIGVLGYDSMLDGNVLLVYGGTSLRMFFSCMGLNLIFVWWSFVIAFPLGFRKSVMFIVIGTISLVLLNIIRLSALSVADDDSVLYKGIIDHHTLYNWIIYVIIGAVIVLIINRKKTNW